MNKGIYYSLVFALVFMSSATSFEEEEDSDNSFSSRIYGGQYSVLGQNPYQALLNIILPKGFYAICGCSLISREWLITAGHCVYMQTDVRIYLGLIDAISKTGAISTYAQKIVVHPNFSNKTLVNDIALLKMPSPVSLAGRNVKTIPLPKLAQALPSSQDDKYAVASGWGRTTNNQTGVTRYLQYARVHIMKWATCKKLFANFQFNQGNICTDKTIYSSPCKGDSGGPLVVNTTANPVTGTLVGLVSWSTGECDNKNPNVYTNVANYLRWINNVTGIAIS